MKTTLPPLPATIAAAVLAVAGPFAHATLVGQWISGAPNLTETSGFRPAGTHDGVAVGPNAGLLAFSSDVPAGFTGQSLDLTGNVGVSVANSSTADNDYRNTYDNTIRSQCTIVFWAKGFPGTWAPWVCKRGEGGVGWQLRRMGDSNTAGFTLRGVANDDGWGSSIDVQAGQPVWHHFAGVWDEASGTRKLYVDGVFSHTVTNTLGQMMTQAPDQRLTLGARANGGTGYEAYFTGKLFDVRIYDTPLTQTEIMAVGQFPPTTPTGLTATPSNGKVGLLWTPAPGATGYTVWTKNTLTDAEETNTTTDAFFTKTGLTNGTPYLFKVMATRDAFTSAYSAEVGATPAPDSAKDILTFTFGAYGNATISGTTITKYLPSTANVTALAPTYTIPFFATGNPVSGTTRDFTFPQTYTITADDSTTKQYTVTVALVSPITYDFTGGLQGWTQLWPTPPSVLWQNNALGSGYDNDDPYTRFGRSPVFYLLDSGPLTFYLDGGQSPLAAPHVGPSAIPELAINGGGFAGVALRDVLTDTYVLSRRRNGNGGGFQQHQFTAAELAPFANDGKQYTLDYIDYNSGGWGWTYMDTVSIPGVAVQPGTEALITSVKIGAVSDSEIQGTDITVWVPHGSDLTALNPVIAVSPGAALSPPLGTVRNFTTPQSYTVTSGNSLVSETYTVTVVADGSLTLKTYDNVPAGTGPSQLDPISNLQGATPSATGTQVADILYGDFAAKLPGLTDNETFAVLWEGWFNVAMAGPGYFTFGTQSDDGSVIYLDINDDGDFADPGELIVNNNGLHGYDVKTGSVWLPMDTVRIAIGFFEEGGGEGMHARFGSGRDLAFGALQNIGGKSGHFTISRPLADPSSAALWNLSAAGKTATAKGTQGTQLYLLGLAPGTDLSTLAPTFLISPGATCVPPSGTARNFSTPQTYTVTSDDETTSVVYTVTARLLGGLDVKTYDTVYGTGNLAPISVLQAQTPDATFTAPDDISFAAYVNGTIPGLTNADFFSALWEGWFHVGAEGPGYYTFGTRSDDGSVIYMDFNEDGDFDDPGELVLNNNYLQGATARTATVWLAMDRVRVAIGFFEQDGGETMEARYAKGEALAYGDLDLIGGNIGTFLPLASPPPNKNSTAGLWYLSYGSDVAVQNGTQLVLTIPVGTDITTLDPTFLISPGATCIPPSGTARDFTTPKTYEVKSQDASTTTVYTVTAIQTLRYDFNGGNLQGWRNVVWDLSANAGAGGWLELAPNATTMPATVNGGAIQPPSVDNGLFGINGGEVYPNGNFDNHLNTHRLRSPVFVLDAVADLTVQLRRGIAHTADPVDEASIPYAAITNDNANPPGGWKGVVLRRVSDGAFLYAKPRTGANGDDWQTITFTKEELEPYDGVACTLELINSDRGGWGWVTMDNVVIPATGLVPLSPYDAWRAEYPDLVGAAGAPGADADLDDDDNLTEWAFGTNPMSGLGGPIDAEGGVLYAPGRPVIATEGGMAIVFGRRADYDEVGLEYTVQFSEDLDYWEEGSTTSTVIATDGEIDAVRVPFPATINPGVGGPKVPRFARVVISTN